MYAMWVMPVGRWQRQGLWCSWERSSRDRVTLLHIFVMLVCTHAADVSPYIQLEWRYCQDAIHQQFTHTEKRIGVSEMKMLILREMNRLCGRKSFIFSCRWKGALWKGGTTKRIPLCSDSEIEFLKYMTNVKLLSHIDALADAQGTNMVVRHTAKYVGCKFIRRSLIGTIRSCAFMCVKGGKKFWTCSKIFFATNAQAYSFIVRWLYGPYVNRSLLGRSL